MAYRNDSTASKIQVSVVVHDPELTLSLLSFMKSSPRFLFNGEGLEVHFGCLFPLPSFVTSSLLPKEF